MPGWVQNLFCSDGIVYGICERSGRDDIFAIDGETGQQLWRIPLEPQEESGKFFAGGGKTYYIDQTGNVYEIIAG
jgi:outer membrane protein assembly factor BamB